MEGRHYDDTGLPIEQIDSAGAVLYSEHDQLGSTVLLTDSVGTVAATYAYGPFGQAVGHTDTADTSLRFAGQHQDSTGLYYLRNRYYDPATAQFLTADPLAALTGQPYSYAGNNPLNGVDPLGLSWYNPASWSKETWVTIGVVAASVASAATGVGFGARRWA